MNLNEQKTALRKRIREQLKKLTPELRTVHSANACLLLEKQAVWKKAAVILFFAPLPEEPDIWPLAADALEAKKIIALPKFIPERDHYAGCEIQNFSSDVQAGQFGIREPKADCAEIPSSGFDLILVPGVAFDLHGNRLGRGKGFYDRLLSQFRGIKCGIAFDEQIENEIPTGAHDVRMDFILTPTRWVKTAG